MPARPGIGMLSDPIRNPGKLKIDPMTCSQGPSLLDQKGEQKGKKSQNWSPSGAEQMVQITQHRRGSSPDEIFLTVILPGHRPETSAPRILGPSRYRALMVICRIHQVSQRHLKCLGNLKRINGNAKTRPHQRNDWGDYILGDRSVVGHLAENFDEFCRQTHFFLGLTQGGVLRT